VVSDKDCATFYKDRRWWAAGSDIDVEGQFLWCYSDRTIPMTITNIIKWENNQPDNAGKKEHCVNFNLDKGNPPANVEYNDFPCSSKLRYVCEVFWKELISLCVFMRVDLCCREIFNSWDTVLLKRFVYMEMMAHTWWNVSFHFSCLRNKKLPFVKFSNNYNNIVPIKVNSK
jgi:hypothetical protein